MYFKFQHFQERSKKVGVTAGAGNLLKWIMENAPNVLQPFMVPTFLFTWNPLFPGKLYFLHFFVLKKDAKKSPQNSSKIYFSNCSMPTI